MIDWDDAFDNGGYVHGSAEMPGRWAAAAAAFRDAQGSAEYDLAYGPGARNRMDIFRPADPRGLVVFIHGGYWRRFDKSFWSLLAAGPLARGWAVAMPSYTLAPDARIATITAEIGQAITAAADLAQGPIRLTIPPDYSRSKDIHSCWKIKL
jgi:acetyl esterase/lipase